jgi:hypothetical protein
MASTSTTERISTRTVVLLKPSARKKLERLAAKEKVSAGEIIRRSIDSYATGEIRSRKEEEKTMKATLDIVMDALERANRSLVDTCSQLDELHLQLEKSNRQ